MKIPALLHCYWLLFAWLLLPFGCAKKQTRFSSQPYYAIIPDGLMQLRIQQDTVNLTPCTNTALCQAGPKYQFKILNTRKVGAAYVLYTETLRYLNAAWQAPNKYRVMGLIYGPDDQTAELIMEINSYGSLSESKSKGDFNPFNKFAISYYTPHRLQQFGAYTSINSIDSNAFWNLKKRLVKEALFNKEMIRRTNTGNALMTDISRELINRAMIAQRINPLISQQELDSSLRKLKANVPVY